MVGLLDASIHRASTGVREEKQEYKLENEEERDPWAVKETEGKD